MTLQGSSKVFDVIVIGSGIGGMAAAAALSRLGHRVCLLEQAPVLGGLTQSFSRGGFTWDVGLHYCGTFGHDQIGARMLDWLSGNSIAFQSVGTVYDTLHFPGDFEVPVARPVEAYQQELRDQFPESAAAIDAYFTALVAAQEAGHMASAERALPEPFRSAHRWWNRKKIERWCARTTAEVVAEHISDPRLAAVLTAQWGTYGGPPAEASFASHAIVLGHYLEGAGYPVGGAAAIATGLIPVIEAAGGCARAGERVQEILLEDGAAVGVRTESGEVLRATNIVSSIGVAETLTHLLPDSLQQSEWGAEISTYKPSICHFDLFLGFEGDIARAGATRSNHWFYESWDPGDAIWSGAADAPIPMAFVSFGSLKNRAHDPGPKLRQSGDMLVWADWEAITPYLGQEEAWHRFKQRVEAQLLDHFKQKFPGLAPLIAYHELGTPLATKAFTGHDRGAFYGIETSPRRMLSDAFSPRTPVPGLYLAGQDVVSPGIAGALAGGMLGAAAIDPRVFQHFR